jgi:membrane associated rhomboid family serine protease
MSVKRARTPLPLTTLALTASILAVYALELEGDGLGLCQRFGFVAAAPRLGTALSALFVHDPSTLWHVAGNAVALVLFGAVVERSLGHFRFVVLYLVGGIGAAAFHVLANPGSLVPEVGASGPIFALMASAAMLYPRLVGFVAAYSALNIWQTITGTSGGVATAAHVGGFVAGFVLTPVVFGRRLAEVRGWRPASRRARRAVVPAAL